MDEGRGISKLYSSTEFLTRRIEFHVARQPDAHSAALTEMEPLNAPLLSAKGGSRDGPEGLGIKGSGKVAPAAMKNGPGSSSQATGAEANDIKLTWPVPQKIGAGLSNLGNTCFLNSVLQCLTYTPPLAAYLQSGQHHASCKAVGFCALCVMEAHVKKAFTAHGQVISPRQMVQNLRCIGKSFRPQRQEDAHEFARYLIEAMQRSSLPPGTPCSSKASERTMMFRFFGGRLCSQVKCTRCSYCSNTYDPFLDLSLEVMHANSLLKALRRFTATEVLDGANKYKCSACKSKVQAYKRLTIEQLPNVLTVQFKRFDGAGAFGGKIDKHIQFDPTMDLTPFLSNTQHVASAKYSLYGVLVHAGATTHSGHYYCFVRSPAALWHVMDDSRVRQVSEAAVLSQNAYMLFYIRQAATTPRPVKFPPAISPKTAALQSPAVGREEAEQHVLKPSSVNASQSGKRELCGSTKVLDMKASAEDDSKGPTSLVLEKPGNGALFNKLGVSQTDTENGGPSVQNVASPGAKDMPAESDASRANPGERDLESLGNGLNGDGQAAVTGLSERNCNGGEDVQKESGINSVEKAKKRKAELDEERFLDDEEEEEMQRRMDSYTSTSDGEEASGSSRRRTRQNKCLWDFHYSQMWPPKNSLMRLLSVNPRTRRFFTRWRHRSLQKRLRKFSCIISVDQSPEVQPIMTRAARRAAAAAKIEVVHEDEARQSPEKAEQGDSTAEVARAELALLVPPQSLRRRSLNGHDKKRVRFREDKSERKEEELENGDTTRGRRKVKEAAEEVDGLAQNVTADVENGEGSSAGEEIRFSPRPNGVADVIHTMENGGSEVEGQGTGAVEEVNGKVIGNGDVGKAPKTANGGENANGTENGGGGDGDGGSKKVVRLPFSKAKGGVLYGIDVPTWGEVDGEREKDVRLFAKSNQVPRKRLDDWDVEYDRGKTKKVKSKNTYGYDDDNTTAANPFQRVAESKVGMKKF